MIQPGPLNYKYKRKDQAEDSFIFLMTTAYHMFFLLLLLKAVDIKILFIVHSLYLAVFCLLLVFNVSDSQIQERMNNYYKNTFP